MSTRTRLLTVSSLLLLALAPSCATETTPERDEDKQDEEGNPDDEPGEDDEPEAKDAGADAKAPDANAPTSDAGKLDGAAPKDAGGKPLDAQAPSADDASLERDAARNATDAAGLDATIATPPGGNAKRAAICGDAPTTGSPFPAGMKMLTAKPVEGQPATYKFLEGPVWLADQGVLLFSDMDFGKSDMIKGIASTIHRFKPPSTFDDFVVGAGSNGLALTNDGNVLAATHDTRSLTIFDAKTAARTDLDLEIEGKAFNSPNDLTVRSDGHVYFTDPDYQDGNRDGAIGDTNVYRYVPPASSGQALNPELIEGKLTKPNGIALSPDEKTLYVASASSDIVKYELGEDGKVGARSPFAKGSSGSDGLGVDCAGNVYATPTGQGVVVFSPAGERLGVISAPNVTNVAFGGPDRKTLFITAGSKLYSIQLEIPGYPY